MRDETGETKPGDGRRKGIQTAVIVAVLVGTGLLIDGYAIYRVHVQRLGNALDFYPFWAGGREVLLKRHNPYQPDVMEEIQRAIYGRLALPGENQHGYAYPAYAPFVVPLFLLPPFAVSASLWIASQQFLLVAAVALTTRAAGWRIGTWRLALLSLAAMLFRYSMITFVLGQTPIWVLCSLALALWAARAQRNTLAGLALAAGAIKPQLVILPALALLASLPSRQRGRVLGTMGGALLLLVGCSWLWIGPWLGDYGQLLGAYQGYSTTEFPVVSLTASWLPEPVCHGLNAAVIAALLALLGAVSWRWRGSGRAALPVAVAVVATQLAVPQTGSYNLVQLLLPAIVALHALSKGNIQRQWLAVGGRVVVWGALLVVPWLLWPTVQQQTGGALDLVAMPALLLAVVVCVALQAPRGKAGVQEQPAL